MQYKTSRHRALLVAPGAALFAAAGALEPVPLLVLHPLRVEPKEKSMRHLAEEHEVYALLQIRQVRRLRGREGVTVNRASVRGVVGCDVEVAQVFLVYPPPWLHGITALACLRYITGSR